MIVHPKDWRRVGRDIQVDEIEENIYNSLSRIKCNSLAFSGGIDSSILLYYMSKVHPKVYAFTMGRSEDHPDVESARLVAKEFPNVEHIVYIPSEEEILENATDEEKALGKEYEGDAAVRLFYKFVSNYTDSIVSGDGIDEFMAGYYAHQETPTEETYYEYIGKLQKEQLIPLDGNSGDVRVYLPYIGGELVCLMSQIPLSKKVDKSNRKKILQAIAKGKVPDWVLERRKRGFLSALWSSEKLERPGVSVVDDVSVTPEKKRKSGEKSAKYRDSMKQVPIRAKTIRRKGKTEK